MTTYDDSIERLMRATLGVDNVSTPRPVDAIARSISLDVLGLAGALQVADGVLNRGRAGGVLVRGRSFEQVAENAAAIIEAGFEDEDLKVPGVPLGIITEIVVASPLPPEQLGYLRSADVPDPRNSARAIGQYFVQVLLP